MDNGILYSHCKEWNTWTCLNIEQFLRHIFPNIYYLKKARSLITCEYINIASICFFLTVHKHWRKCLRVPWTARRSNQSILKEINPEYSLEKLRLKLKLQYSGLLMGRADSLEKTLTLGRIEDKRKRGWKRMRWTWFNGHEFEQTLGDSEGQGSLACCSLWGPKESDMT